MNDRNPYQVPEAPLPSAPLALDGAEVLAGRGERFGAALIDGVIALATFLPLAALTGYFGKVMAAARGGDAMSLLAMAGYVALVFVVVQGYPLARTGQTWGKKLLSIRIVDLHGELPPLWRLIVLRYLPTQLLSLVPVAGNVYALLDALFIFRQDKRCLHDIIAGIQVVNVRR